MHLLVIDGIVGITDTEEHYIRILQTDGWVCNSCEWRSRQAGNGQQAPPGERGLTTQRHVRYERALSVVEDERCELVGIWVIRSQETQRSNLHDVDRFLSNAPLRAVEAVRGVDHRPGVLQRNLFLWVQGTKVCNTLDNGHQTSTQLRTLQQVGLGGGKGMR